jgi:hypothetical protein
MKKCLVIGLTSSVGLIVLFISTHPRSMPSFVLLVPFVAIFVSLLSLSYAGLRFLGLGAARAIRASFLTSGLPTLLLVLQSIGQLTARDVLGVFVLLALSYFYLLRTSVSRPGL